ASLCGRLGVPLRTRSADVRARAVRERRGIEDAARRERYAFLGSVLREEGASAIAVGHTRDDQAETLLLRLVRGAGRAGLAAMRARQGNVIRPLLELSRSQVLDHLRRRGLPWREDPTNGDPSFLRNRVRHELLPLLEARFNPGIRASLARTAALLGEETDYLEGLAGDAYALSAREDGGETVVSCAALRDAPRAVARRVIRRAIASVGGLAAVSGDQVDRVLALASGPASSGRRLPLPGGREAVFSFGEVRFGRRRAPTGPFSFPLRVPGRVVLPQGGTLVAQASQGPASPPGSAAVVAMPEGDVEVRSRRPGDRVRSGGREVSLKRFLSERRVPADRRSALPVVAVGHRVLWIPGHPVESSPEGHRRFVLLELEARA
ncbi:MAG TPA: tRNA lysidine(34) synthetase TilS, partial [Vicinamibacteria bacterium]